ncbi:hypothetical protein PPUJ20066_28340 [Pseudomonas putida]|nr:hypothetical protein PPUJ20066_28340 [Pseudomonas putida]
MRNVSCMIATGVTAKQAVRLRQALSRTRHGVIRSSVFRKKGTDSNEKTRDSRGFLLKGAA